MPKNLEAKIWHETKSEIFLHSLIRGTIRETKVAASLLLMKVHNYPISNFFWGESINHILAYSRKEETQRYVSEMWDYCCWISIIAGPEGLTLLPKHLTARKPGAGGNRAQFLIWFNIKIIGRLSSVPQILPEFTWVTGTLMDFASL